MWVEAVDAIRHNSFPGELGSLGEFHPGRSLEQSSEHSRPQLGLGMEWVMSEQHLGFGQHVCACVSTCKHPQHHAGAREIFQKLAAAAALGKLKR